MKKTSIGWRSNRASLLVVVLVLLFSTVQLHGQFIPVSTIEISTARSMDESILQAMEYLDTDWDRSSYNMIVPSSTLLKMNAARESAPSIFAVYSFKGNVEAPSGSKQADDQLKTMALLLKKATDELAEISKQNSYKGQLKQLKPLLEFLGFSVSNMPIPVQKLDVSRLKLTKLRTAELVQSGLVAEALTNAAEKVALSSKSAQKKHLAFKYLAASVLTIPAVWAYLEPEFSRLAREGGATTDNLYFAKLYMDRVPFFEDDSRIWKEAPRFYLSQLKVSNPANKTRNGKPANVELTDTETKVTVSYTISAHETWYRFDENSVLVDSDTKERYPIKRIEGGIPLGKTIVLVGCGGSTIDFTFVFPRVKESMKSFFINEVDPAPSSEAGRKAYYKAHNIMSDGSSSLSSMEYTLSDYVK